LTRQIPTSCLPKRGDNMAFLYEACDQISDSCHQYLLRKMRRKMCIYKCMLNVYENQQNRQIESRNLMGRTTLPTIWGTYMKLVVDVLLFCMPLPCLTPPHLCAWCHMSLSIYFFKMIVRFIIPPLPEGEEGYTALPLSVCPSLQPDIEQNTFIFKIYN
jgi:hypothetical protein